jgi:hypothetical protein
MEDKRILAPIETILDARGSPPVLRSHTDVLDASIVADPSLDVGLLIRHVRFNFQEHNHETDFMRLLIRQKPDIGELFRSERKLNRDNPDD